MTEPSAGRPDSAEHDRQGVITGTYDRNARFYDLCQAPMDLVGGRRRRRRLLARARGRVLEVGIGTGRNLDDYPEGVELTGVDVSTKMLDRARRRAERRRKPVKLDVADVRQLPYADASFDSVVGTCVFCSVADPVRGLAEVRRVVSPDGQVLLVEHVRPRNRFFGWLFDRLAPLVRRIAGAEINRRTEENIEAAGLDIVEVRRSGVWREIVARPAP